MNKPENNPPRKSGKDIFIIGYGNETRGDDGAGRRLADEVESWRMTGVKTLSLRQLNPEVAASLSEAGHVVFVDATPGSGRRSETHIRPLDPGETPAASTHHCTPSRVLTLARMIHGWIPPATLLTIPGERFGWEESLSPTASANLNVALQAVRRLIDTERRASR